MATDIDLSGKRILLVEDDTLIRHDVAGGLIALGADVVSTGRLTEAIELIEGDISHAVLDVKLEDGNVQPVASRLKERGVPFTFYSSAARCSGLADRFPAAVVLAKPAMPTKLAAIIQRAGAEGALS